MLLLLSVYAIEHKQVQCILQFFVSREQQIITVQQHLDDFFCSPAEFGRFY